MSTCQATFIFLGTIVAALLIDRCESFEKRGFADCNKLSETNCPYGSIEDRFCPGTMICLKGPREQCTVGSCASGLQCTCSVCTGCAFKHEHNPVTQLLMRTSQRYRPVPDCFNLHDLQAYMGDSVDNCINLPLLEL